MQATSLLAGSHSPDERHLNRRFGCDPKPINESPRNCATNETLFLKGASMEVKLQQKRRLRFARRGAVLFLCAFFVGGILGTTVMDVSATAIGDDESLAVRSCVYVTSTKKLSNVVMGFCDGTIEKFGGLSGRRARICGTGQNKWKEVCCVWIKSGCNKSGDGPGYGEKIVNPWTGVKVHGDNKDEGCIPHVTARFKN